MPIWEYGPERAVYRIFHCGGRGCVWSRCRARMIRLHGFPQLEKDFWKK